MNTYILVIFVQFYGAISAPRETKFLKMSPAVQTEEREEEVEALEDSEFGPLSISKLEVKLLMR